MCVENKVKRRIFSNLIILLVTSNVGSSVKIWRMDTNFGNPDNWEGFSGLCGKTIYSFDAWLDPSVISFPPQVTAKQILLPNNGHFIFPTGFTSFSDFDNETRAACPSRETKFKRNKPGDWFDPNNWMDSLEPGNKAVGHVQRVPCGYDSVKFMENSSFSVFISANVAIRQFFVGDKSLSYTVMGLYISTNLGQIQFQKRPVTVFSIREGHRDCEDGMVTSDDCICENYGDSKKRHICSLVECTSVEEDCPSPITPHGFCCPICGYHVRIQHRTGFSLKELKEKVKEELKNVKSSVHFYVTSYKKNGVHIVFVPLPNVTALVYKSVRVVRDYLQQQSQVVEVSVSKSWEHLDETGMDSSASGPGGPMLSFIILTVILVLGGLACLIFYWKKTGYPSMTSIWPPSCPSMPTIPSLPRMQLPTRLIGSDTAPSFAFARFSNERISHLNLGSAFAGHLARTEAVDETVGEAGTGQGQGQGQSSETLNVAFDGDSSYDIVDSPQEIMGKTDNLSTEPEHVYDLIEVTEDSDAVLTSSMDNLVSATTEE